ncbi:uncharacterized protein LOC126823754 [Patella vulgata]|uniref:uncharacterized protein LOC126823754 n=1 Tax=Patella vulgata TaxID=6465 RepID=UPI00217FAE0F|nr:uncharacterized protein LOC126823754 [Patella vulgata]
MLDVDMDNCVNVILVLISWLFRKPENEKEIISKIQKHRDDFVRFVTRRQKTIFFLSILADELDTDKKKIRASKIASSVGGLFSAGLTVAGALTLPTGFGAPLIAVGGVVGALSSATSVGGSIADKVLSKNTKQRCNKALADDDAAVKEYQKSSQVFRNFIVLSAKSVSPVGSIAATVIEISKFTDFTIDATGAAAKNVPIIGAVLSVITLPIDIATLISNAADIHKCNPHQISIGIRKQIEELQDELEELQTKHDKEQDELDNILYNIQHPPMTATEAIIYISLIAMLIVMNVSTVVLFFGLDSLGYYRG